MTDRPTSDQTPDPAASPQAAGTCAACGEPYAADATFCEACGADIAPAAGGASPAASGHRGVATPNTAAAGEESPLDVGWTGPVEPRVIADPAAQRCTNCSEGVIVDGYCDTCGTKPPDPRNHIVAAPASWVGGVCDIGKRHSRNEDAIALSASEPAGSRAVLVVCDGVSMATDSHIASAAAADAARAVLDQPFPRGVGTTDAWQAGVERALTAAVTGANQAVVDAVVEDVPNPPSCTFAAAVIEDSRLVAGNVGDSRAYWLPDDPSDESLQLGRDDSYAWEQMEQGVAREEAENGPNAHSITRWLGKDSPDDLTPHLTTVTLDRPGWVMVCSDGLWNYLSEASGLRDLVARTVERIGDGDPTAVAQALVDFANDQGGRDNITVALARIGGQGSKTAPPTSQDVAQSQQDGSTVAPQTMTPAAPGVAAQEGDQTDG